MNFGQYMNDLLKYMNDLLAPFKKNCDYSHEKHPKKKGAAVFETIY